MGYYTARFSALECISCVGDCVGWSAHAHNLLLAVRSFPLLFAISFPSSCAACCSLLLCEGVVLSWPWLLFAVTQRGELVDCFM